MTEPKVGMAFGTYNQIAGKALKGKKVEVSQQTNENLHGGARYVQDNLYAKNSNGAVFACRGAKDPTSKGNGKAPELYAEVALLDDELKAYLTYDGITYKRASSYMSGTAVDNTSDVRFNRIRGKECYALDLNNNGFVDNGEIFPIAQCDGIKDQEMLDKAHKKLNIEG
jgi:hypothetical protein